MSFILNNLAAALRKTPRWLPKRVSLAIRLDRLRSAEANPFRTFRLNSGGLMMVDLRSGTERWSYYLGEYDYEWQNAAVRLLTPGSFAIDVGANIGLWTVRLARELSTSNGIVHAFEPVPSNFERLQENVRLNDLTDSVVCHQSGLSDARGPAKISLREDFAAGAETGNAGIIEESQDYETIEIALRRCDELVNDFRPRRCSFIKVDIEGHEDAFLRGARKLLATDRPCVLCELNKYCFRSAQRDHSDALETAIEGLGYGYIVRDGSVFSLSGRFDSPREIDDLLLVPLERIDETCKRLNTASRGSLRRR